MRYANYALSSRAAQRIFAARREPAPHGGMAYADFVWFLLAEEDKQSPASIQYWFHVLDTNGDGIIDTAVACNL